MADSHMLYNMDDSTETENSSPSSNAEPDNSNSYVQMQQLLPSRSSAVNDRYAMWGDIASILPYATLSRRQMSRLPLEEHANAITTHLRLNSKLIQDDPKSYKLRIETLRAMPQCLTIKRSVKSKLQETVLQKPKVKNISYWKWVKYRSSYTFTRIHMVIRDTAPTLEIWHRTIKAIEGQCGSGIAAYFKFLRWLICLNIISCILSVSFIILPQSVEQAYVASNISSWDFLTGSGFFENTIMYYGFYTNSTVYLAHLGTAYNIPSAYFITLLCCYIFTLILLSIKVATSYRKRYIEIRGNVQNMYSNKIFCGWDFSISTLKTAGLHSASIYRELEELLAEAKQQSRPTCFEKFVSIVIRITVTLIVIAIICGTAILLWILLDKYEMDMYNPVSVMVVPMVVTIIVQTFPVIISWLALLENHSNKRTMLYITVIRIHAMAGVVIGTNLIFWLINSTAECWQTKLGEEIYRLILLDFFTSTIGAHLFVAIRSALNEMGWKQIKKTEFNIACSTLNLIYNQTLFWAGFYFSPFMSIIILIKMIVTFYVKKYGSLKYYAPPSRPWRAAQTETLFLALAFLGMVGVFMGLGYVIIHMRSTDCGPFSGYNNAWDFVIEDILSVKKDSETWKIILVFTSPATGAAILIGMCIAVYCLRAKVEASKELLQILKEMLVLQSRDKEFLMKSLSTFDNERHVFKHDMSSLAAKDSIVKHTRFAISVHSNEKSFEETQRDEPSSSDRGNYD